MKDKSQKPKILIKEMFLDPEHGISMVVKDAPKGYAVKSVEHGRGYQRAKAKVTYELI